MAIRIQKIKWRRRTKAENYFEQEGILYQLGRLQKTKL